MMHSFPILRRWLAAGAACGVLIVVAALGSLSGRAITEKELKEIQKQNQQKNYPWPLFGGTLQRNLVNLVDTGIPDDFAVDPEAPKRIKWTANLGSKSYGGPVVAEGKVFIGTNNEQPRDPKITEDRGVIMCFDAGTGKFLWQNTYKKLPSGLVNDWPREGICSTPIVENGKLYYVSNRCEVVCAQTSTGKEVWKYDMIENLKVFPHNLSTCSPLIAGDLVFVCTSNGVDEGHINIPSPQAPSFIAIHKDTGKLAWQNNDPSKNLLKAPAGGDRDAFIKKLVNSGQLLMHGQWANPAYAEVNGVAQVIFPGGDGWLRAFDPTSGKVIWKFDCNPKDTVYELGAKGTRNDFVNTPIISNNKLYIGVGQDPEHREAIGHFWCIDLDRAVKLGKTNPDGDVSPKDNNFDSKAAVNMNSALAWHYGGRGTKEEAIPGRNYVFGRTLSTACVHDGVCYIAELAGYVHCLDAETGKRHWYHNVRAPIWSSPYYVDGKIFMGTDDEVLYVFEHGREKNILAEIDMFGKVRATPIVANGTMYIMTETKLYAIR